MGMLSSIGDFLFGKSPDIFDKNGNVTHRMTKRTWDAWSNRIKMDPDYNWRNHTGTRAGTRPADDQTSKKSTDNPADKK